MRAQREIIVRTIKKEGWKADEYKQWQKYEDEMTPKERYNLGMALFEDIKARKKKEQLERFEKECQSEFDKYLDEWAPFVPRRYSRECPFHELKLLWKETEIDKQRVYHHMKNRTLDQINISTRTDQMVYGSRLKEPPIWVRLAPKKINDMEVLQEALG